MKVKLLFLFLAFGAAACAQEEKPVRTLIVGGGASHDFDRWYRQADVATLEKDGLAEVDYTDRIDSVLSFLPALDVLVLTNNQPMEDPALRQAIFDFVDAGKGLVLAHAATWYNWEDWPEYNRQLVGGGARSHNPYGPFQVSITADHPITAGVEKQFVLDDELYHLQTDPAGADIQILATGKAEGEPETFPVLWITAHPQGRIVGFTLGHDAASHDLAAYQEILKNALLWSAGREIDAETGGTGN